MYASKYGSSFGPFLLRLAIKRKERKGKERKGKERKGKERKGKERKEECDPVGFRKGNFFHCV
jgi:hypothetical protein